MISMIVKESPTVVYEGFNSTAIKSVSIFENTCTVVFNSSDKEYNYTIIDSNFVELLDKTIKNGDSVGKFINISLKEKNIEQIQVESK